MIDEYHFGSITISGKNYNHDVEVHWDGTILSWWRRESHIIDVEDVKRAVEKNPQTIIIGTGESGVAEVTEAAKIYIREKGIELIIDRTEKSAKTFNSLKKRKVIGLFHLTC